MIFYCGKEHGVVTVPYRTNAIHKKWLQKPIGAVDMTLNLIKILGHVIYTEKLQDHR